MRNEAGIVILTIGFIFGSIQIIRACIWTLYFLYRHAIRPIFTRSLYARYANHKGKLWALVTGGSDGIGLEMCHQLAAQGFNILMCGRNEAKINEKLASITSKVQKKALVIDLGSKTSIQEYREILSRECSGLDIVAAFLNAGSFVVGPVDLISDAQLEQIVTLNGLHVVYMAKILLERMTRRNVEQEGARSCLVVTSSGLANFPMPGIISYSSTKILVSRFCEATAEEVRSKGIDVMAWEAGGVTTNLNPGKGFMNLTVKQAVSGCFSKIGFESKSDGHWLHEFMMLGAGLFSLSLFGTAIAK
jgi:short-subunit dehydrogenase